MTVLRHGVIACQLGKQNITAQRRSLDVVANVQDYNIRVSEFELQSRYYVHFRTKFSWERHEPTYPFRYTLNSTTSILLCFALDNPLIYY